jgi:hypothetical protein
MCDGPILAEWEPLALEDPYCVFLVRRACAACGREWQVRERVSELHPGGIDGAIADRDGAASANHVYAH